MCLASATDSDVKQVNKQSFVVDLNAVRTVGTPTTPKIL